MMASSGSLENAGGKPFDLTYSSSRRKAWFISLNFFSASVCF